MAQADSTVLRLLKPLCLLLLVAACAHHPRPISDSGGVNTPEQQQKPYLVLVSLDGFRWDYLDRHDLPNLQRMAMGGFRAERLIPVFPTLTFPNHYSIATGLYPSRHGLVANHFPAPELDSWYSLGNRETVEDGRFYGGEPVWVTAESQGMVTASFFFVGTEAAIHGVRPTSWRSYSKEITGEERVDQVLAWLREPAIQRPHLLTLYFEFVDDTSHWYGVESAEAIEAMHRVDALLGRLLQGIESLPHGDRVNVMVVSDHGQASYHQPLQALVLEQVVELQGIRVVGSGSYAFLYFDETDEARISSVQNIINQHWKHGVASRPNQLPHQWHVGDNDRWPQLVLLADEGYAVAKTAERAATLNPGSHGASPDQADMHGILLGYGPSFTPGKRVGPVRAVDVQPLILSVLGLDGVNGDGDPGALRPVMAP